jgi:hypothetical protein
MARSFFQALSLAALCGSLSLSTLGCAAAGPDDDTSSSEEAIASTKIPGIDVNVEVVEKQRPVRCK